jgi:hypothetical protein
VLPSLSLPRSGGGLEWGAVPRRKEGKHFFFEKSSKKLLIISASVCQERPKPNLQKFFASFFQKRRPFF